MKKNHLSVSRHAFLPHGYVSFCLRSICVTLLCLTTACSAKGKKAEGIAEGASVGALSGAAIGGGIGAIVGSTSGHVGEGLAVGALAGGAVGGAVGAAVGDYRGKQAARADSLSDQEKELREQRRESESIREDVRDEASLVPTSRNVFAKSSGYGTPVAGAGDTYGVRDGYRGNPRAKPYRSKGTPSTAIAPVASVRLSSETRARLAEAPVAKNKAAFETSSKVAKGTKSQLLEEEGEGGVDALSVVDEPPVRTLGAGNSLTAAAEAGLKPAVQPVEQTVKAAAGTAQGAVAKGSSAAVAGTQSAATTGQAVVAKQLGKLPVDSTATCIQAEKEAARATTATSDADRLFYLGRASRLCPTSDTYQVELGKVFAKIGKVQEAKSAYRKALELNDQNDVARDELSVLENSVQ